MHGELYLAVSYINGRRFQCLSMVKIGRCKQFWSKDTSIACLIAKKEFILYDI